MRIVMRGLTKEPKFLTLYLQWKERYPQVSDQAKKETASW
jgi:hypothetical protein